MKKLVVASAAALVLTISVVTAQTTYACFCIPGIIWEKDCGPKPEKPTKPTTPTTPTQPTTPVEQPQTPETPTPPTVVTASTVVKTTPVAATEMPAELPQTGDSSTLTVMAVLGVASYLGTYGYLRFIKK